MCGAEIADVSKCTVIKQIYTYRHTYSKHCESCVSVCLWALVCAAASLLMRLYQLWVNYYNFICSKGEGKDDVTEMNLLILNKSRSVKSGVSAFTLLRGFKSTKHVYWASVGMHFEIINEPKGGLSGWKSCSTF